MTCSSLCKCWSGLEVNAISIININNGIKEATPRYQDCSTSQISYLMSILMWKNPFLSPLLFGSILIETISILGPFYLGMKVLVWYLTQLYWEQKNILSNVYHMDIQNDGVLIIDAWIVSKKDDTNPTLVYSIKDKMVIKFKVISCPYVMRHQQYNSWYASHVVICHGFTFIHISIVIEPRDHGDMLQIQRRFIIYA